MTRFLFAFLLCLNVDAATYYVRPPGATYGSANGTSYNDAWAGYTNITGFAFGDTLYVCGRHSDTAQSVAIPSGGVVRMDYGPDPGTNTLPNAFWFSTHTNITFLNCHFLTNYPFVTTGNTFVTNNGCTFAYGIQNDLYYGHDYWSYLNCEMSYAKNGIYTHINAQPSGPNYLTVSNCYIHNVGLGSYLDADGHCIAIQGGSNCKILNNRCAQSGAAIEFWTQNQSMTNNLIQGNFISGVYVESGTIGEGIGLSGDNTLSTNGVRVGNRIIDNIVMNTGLGTPTSNSGYGIDSNNKDPMDVFNNTVYNCYRGIRCVVQSAGQIVTGSWSNNIVMNPTDATKYFVFSGTNYDASFGTGNNLSYPDGTNGWLFVPARNAGTGNVNADPSFASATPTIASDFRLNSGSPAIGAGAPVGLATDFGGNAFANPPSIGAWELVHHTYRMTVGNLILGP